MNHSPCCLNFYKKCKIIKQGCNAVRSALPEHVEHDWVRLGYILLTVLLPAGQSCRIHMLEKGKNMFLSSPLPETRIGGGGGGPFRKRVKQTSLPDLTVAGVKGIQGYRTNDRGLS
jgi:hypothetical protein